MHTTKFNSLLNADETDLDNQVLRKLNIASKFGHSTGDTVVTYYGAKGGSFYVVPSSLETPTKVIEGELEKKIDEIYEQLSQLFSSEVQYLNGLVKDLREKVYVNNKELFTVRKELNLQKLDKISNLAKNWAGNEGEVIDSEIIKKTRNLIISKELKVQPHIFPNRNGTIKFEYEQGEKKFLSIEILQDEFEVYYEIDNNEKEFKTKDFSEIKPLINEFQQK